MHGFSVLLLFSALTAIGMANMHGPPPSMEQMMDMPMEQFMSMMSDRMEAIRPKLRTKMYNKMQQDELGKKMLQLGRSVREVMHSAMERMEKCAKEP
ncbi:unnamed protein product [Dicrocoelium dendriticum]|nr:unnamed protein product [Dicrocoelium dendriticum]